MALSNIVTNDFYLKVVSGKMEDFSVREILGQNTDIGSTPELIWNTGGDLVEATSPAVVYVSSTSTSDIGKDVTIVGINENYDEITEVVKTNGQTSVASKNTFLAINEVKVSEALAGTLYVYYSSTTTAGVPDNLAKIQATVDVGDLQSYSAFYCVPRNKNLYLTSLRYSSTGSTTDHNVTLTIQKKLYGEAQYSDVDVFRYTDPGTSYIDNQIDFSTAPVLFPAKSKFKMTAVLGTTGTGLNIAVEAKFIEENIEVAAVETPIISKVMYDKILEARGTTIASLNYYLVGLDEMPASIPTSFNLNNVLAIIEGNKTTYKVAENTTVIFNPSYFSVNSNSGIFIDTSKPALLTVMQCVDGDGNIDFIFAPMNTLVDLGGGAYRLVKIEYHA